MKKLMISNNNMLSCSTELGSLTNQGWFRTNQVAKYLGTSPNNIRNMVYKGHLKPRKFSGRWYFKRSEIDHLIETKGE